MAWWKQQQGEGGAQHPPESCQEPEPAAAEQTSPLWDIAKPRAVQASPGPAWPSHSLLERTGNREQGGPHPAAASNASQCQLLGGVEQPQAHSMQHPGSRMQDQHENREISEGKNPGMSDTAAWVIPVPQGNSPSGENLLLGIHIPELRWGGPSKCSLWSEIQAEP